MNCQNNCQETNCGFFQGDDLVDVITVNRPENSDDITITKAELQVGTLPVFVKNNPVFPYSVSIMRNQSVLLAYKNPIYLRITYTDTNGNENVRQTCLGTLTMTVNAQVVRDSDD